MTATHLRSILVASLFALSLVAPSTARANDCAIVRRARALLIQRGLDDSSLRAIEPSVCAAVAVPVVPQPQPQPPVVVQPQPQPQPAVTPACNDYRTMLALADIDPSRINPQQRVWIEQLMAGACRGWSSPRESWPNGTTARSPNGALYYPTGITARSSSGQWYYPAGLTVTNGGRFYWPNGLTARDAEGNWYSPRGLRSAPGALLGEACSASFDRRFCGRAWGEPQPFEFIAFVWRARGGR
ncbi:MAG: hypothetical protein JNK05_26970 [Myxococcales bacterium]|nr:hypothetical protein [Myxococcales bacterium]